MWSGVEVLVEKGAGSERAQQPKRRKHALAFPLWSVMDNRWRNRMAQRVSVCSSPEAKAEDLAS